MVRPMVHPEDAQEDVRLTTVLLGLFAVVVGVGTLMGGEGRWADDIYQFALTIPGSPESWGIPILVTGVLTVLSYIVGAPKCLALGLFLCGTWFAFIGISFAMAFFDSTAVSFMATAMAWMFSLLYAQKAWVQWAGRNIGSVVWVAHERDTNA